MLYHTPGDLPSQHHACTFHYLGHTAVILEHRYVDDVSQVAMYPASVPDAFHNMMRTVLAERRQTRYRAILHYGGLTWEAGQPLTFIGLQKTWEPNTGMQLSPLIVTPHTTPDSQPPTWLIKSIPPHHSSWCRRAQPYGAVAGLLQRCQSLSTTDTLGITAASWVLYIMLHNCEVPLPLLRMYCARWQSAPGHSSFAATHALAIAERRHAELIPTL